MSEWDPPDSRTEIGTPISKVWDRHAGTEFTVCASRYFLRREQAHASDVSIVNSDRRIVGVKHRSICVGWDPFGLNAD